MIIDLKTGVELEKCPFCGSEPKLRSDNGVQEGTAMKMTTPRFWVKCSSDPCGISTRSQEKEEEAIALWNQRA